MADSVIKSAFGDSEYRLSDTRIQPRPRIMQETDSLLALTAVAGHQPLQGERKSDALDHRRRQALAELPDGDNRLLKHALRLVELLALFFGLAALPGGVQV